MYVVYAAIKVIDADKVSQCNTVNSQIYCLYTNDSVLRWNEAREFCVRRNSTLPIITDENTDNVFQRFIENSNSLVQNSSVWLDARRVNNSVRWHWIDGQSSGIVNTVNFTE